MNQKTHTSASGAAIAFIAASVIFAVLVVAVKFLVNVPAVDADRGAAISKALSEIRTNETAMLQNAGWMDQSNRIVRLPIETAIQMTEHNWQNPAQARKDLILRVERVTATSGASAKTNAAK